MKKTLLKSVFVALAGLGLVAGNALSTPINGVIQLTGQVTLTGGTSFQTATGIEFLEAVGDLHLDQALVSDASFTLAPTKGLTATMQDFQFSPFVANNPVWSVDGFSFAMNSITYDSNNGTFLNLAGTGTISGNGYDATVGTFTFSTQNTGDVDFSWSGSTSTSPVPEPATMLLFGTGIAGLAGIARRKRS